MDWAFWLIVFLLFIVGGIGIIIIGRKQNQADQKKNRLKFITYFLIVNTLFGLIFFAEKLFATVCFFIFIAGLYELINLQKNTHSVKKSFFYLILLSYLALGILFCLFSYSSDQQLLLLTLFTVCSFDAFCQLIGQLLGKKKICPEISPNKTLEGFIGGIFISVCVLVLLSLLLSMGLFRTIGIGLIICLTAFCGDLAASWVKRKYGVKDFSSFLPGHGGFLDRFDSLITAGAFIYIVENMNLQLLYCCLFCLFFVLLIVFCEYLFKKGMDVEYTRKIAHSVSTLSCLLFPILFSSHWYVLILVILSFCLLFFGNKIHSFPSIDTVDRKTYGSYLLPISIGITYYLSVFFQNSILFLLPIAILAISDPLACIFGKAFESKIIKNQKTLIGTSVFFLSAFVISIIILFIASSDMKNIWIALSISSIVSLTELLSQQGSDNLTIPLSVTFSLIILM